MFRTALRCLPAGRRLYSAVSATDYEALNKWIATPREKVLDGTRQTYAPPKEASPLGYGHHLAFFHSRVPESQLKADGTDADFSPPEPFTRRMWAGGKMTWNPDSPLMIGAKATATWGIDTVEKKGFDDPQKNPMVFVNQRLDIKMAGATETSVVEERNHVYISSEAGGAKKVREVRDIPTTSDFSFQYKPSLATLFRFSAIMFNAHSIHLDLEFTQKEDGFPERLVHGPLTALMLLETANFHNPGLQIKTFEYRAHNPVYVNRTSTIHGAWDDSTSIKLWCIDEHGVVGMVGLVRLL